MKVEAEKKTRTQDSERTINGQAFVVAKPTAVVNGSSIDVDFIKKGFCPIFYTLRGSLARTSNPILVLGLAVRYKIYWYS